MPGILTSIIFGGLVGAFLPAAVPVILGSSIIGGAVLYGGLALLSRAFIKKPQGSGGGIAYGDNSVARQLRIEPATDAVWVLGRAKLSGLLTRYNESIAPIRGLNTPDAERGKSDLIMFIVLSEGPCHKLVRIVIDGEQAFDIVEKRPNYFEPKAGSYYWYREVIKLPDGSEQINEYPLIQVWFVPDNPGLCGVQVKLTQPPYRLDNQDQGRFWKRRPQLGFIIEGFAIPATMWTEVLDEDQRPQGIGPLYTRNAAWIRYWFERDRRGRPPEAFDLDSVRRAIDHCEERVNGDLRYAIDGIITSGDDLNAIADEMDFAWQGGVQEIDGKLHFEPGRNIPDSEAFYINAQTDTIENVGVRPAPAVNDRVNQLSLTVAQDNLQFQPQDIGPVRDETLIKRDGEVRPRDLGTKPLVSNIRTVKRLMAIMLRRNRASAVYTYRLPAGANFQNLQMLPNRVVRLTDAQFGLDNARMLITRQTLDNWNVDITLIDHPEGIYDDTDFVPDVLPEPDFTPARELSLPPPPVGLRVTSDIEILEDGRVEGKVKASWEPSAYAAVCQITADVGGFQETAVTENDEITFIVDRDRFYTVSVRHRSIDRQDGPIVTSQRIMPPFFKAIPPAPEVSSFRAYTNFAHVTLQMASQRNIAGIELRYFYEEPESLVNINLIETEDDWEAAARLDVVTLIPSLNDQGAFISFAVPQAGRYRIAGRYRTLTGQESPIGDFGERLFVSEHPGDGTYLANPLFGGTLENMSVYGHPVSGLVYDPGTTDLTRATWNGANGWPFGLVPERTAVSYTTLPLIFNSPRRLNVQARYLSTRPVHPTLTQNSIIELVANSINFVMETKVDAADPNWTETRINHTSFRSLPDARVVRMRATFDEGFGHASISELGFDYRVRT